MYINNFMDRSALGQARLGTLEEDLDMNPDGTQFNAAISILFVGYITMQLPSNLLLSRLRPSLYLGGELKPAHKRTGKPASHCHLYCHQGS